MTVATFPRTSAALPNPLTISQGGTSATDAPTARTNLGLGTLSVQNAHAVNITGGDADLASLDVTGNVNVTGTIIKNNAPGDGHIAFFSTQQAAGGTNRWALNCSGDAASYFGGNVGIKAPTLTHTLTINGNVFAQGSIQTASGYFASNFTGDNAIGLYTDMSAAGGSNRWAIHCAGSAPVYFGQASVTASRIGIGITSVNGLLEFRYNGSAAIFIQATGGGLQYPAAFVNSAGSWVGYITSNDTSTTYVTSSDARLKTAIAPLTGALSVVQALKPVAFRWRANDAPGHGFLAHEVQALVPDAVSGTPDDVDPTGQMIPQGVDASRLVVWTVGAIQELAQRVQALEAA